MKRLALASLLFASNAAADARPDVTYKDKTVTHDCDKAGKKVSVIGKATVTLVGRCTQLIVAGTGNTVTGSTQRVAVAGSSNSVTVEQIEDIVMMGSGNTLTWKSAADGKTPRVSNNGKNTVVGPVEKK